MKRATGAVPDCAPPPLLRPVDEDGCRAVEAACGSPCAWHGRCTQCGDVIHLGPVDGDMHLPLLQAVSVVLGDPPRCWGCRNELR